MATFSTQSLFFEKATNSFHTRIKQWLSLEWNKTEPTIKRIARVKDWLHHFGNRITIKKCMEHDKETTEKEIPLFAVHESDIKYGAEYADISF